LILEVEDSNLDIIRCFDYKTNQKIGEAGDWLHYQSNEYNSYLPVFKVPRDNAEIVLQVSKKEGGLSIPINALNKYELMSKQSIGNAFAFFYIGSLTIILIAFWVFFVVLRNILFLQYSFYIISLLFYYLSTFQYGNQYLWKDLPQINDWLRAIFASFVFFTYARFSISFLDLNKVLPKTAKFINLLTVIGLCFFLFSGPYSPFNGTINNYFLHFFNFLVVLFLLIILLIAVLFLKNKNDSIKVYIFALIPIVFAVFILVAMENGLVVDNFLLKNSLWIASIIESICFLIFITIRNRLNLELRLKLEKDLFQKSIKLLEIEKQVSEKEKRRISAYLHDKVLPLLIVVRRRMELQIFDFEKDKVIVNELIDHTRDISHDLSVDIRSKSELFDSLKKLFDIEINIQKEFVFEWEESELTEEFKADIYKIAAELLANVIKHANAKYLKLHLMKDKKTLRLDFIHNGNIYDFENQPHEGIGIANIKNSVIKHQGQYIFQKQNVDISNLTILFNHE
jgi:signal transduction histidine kinase